MSNKTLIIILGLLLGIFIITKLSDRRGQRSFKDVLVELDTSKVDRILLKNVQDDQAVTELKRQEANWIASNGELEVDATQNTINSLLNNLQLIKSRRLVSKSEDKWADYEVNEEMGTKVEVYSGKKLLEEFIIGRFNFNQQTRTATSYIRKADESDTYSVDGFLSMSFNQSFNSFRDKTLVKFNADDINQIRMTGANGDIALNKIDNHWSSAGGAEIDSSAMSQYLGGIASTFGSEFEDGFSGTPDQSAKKLEISGNNMLSSIVVRMYETQDSVSPFIIHSSMNDAAYFKSDSSGVYERLFTKLEENLGLNQ